MSPLPPVHLLLLLLLCCCSSSAMALSSTAAAAAAAARRLPTPTRIVTIPEETWRRDAFEHSERIRSLLAPGLTSPPPPQPQPSHRRRSGPTKAPTDALGRPLEREQDWTALDRRNPVYNFLIEYYGLKGAKGPRRLGRWSPDLGLLTMDGTELEGRGLGCECDASSRGIDDAHGILLENASEDDFGTTLHLKGATVVPPRAPQGGGEPKAGGILYSPALFYRTRSRAELIKAAAPFQWYRSILYRTADPNREPILHCHGLHEWAMQYNPPDAPPPPSSRYQSHLSLRVTPETINEAVERKGISCTHVDALRFFAPAAGPLNHHGSKLQRTDQLRLEQKGCVHAHMDLLKIAIRLSPFVDAALLADALNLALAARRLDVEASPYDVTPYGLGVVPVETSAGRAEYRRRQRELMAESGPVRERLVGAYDAFLGLAFDETVLRGAEDDPAAERFAVAEPGGAPWRRNLIENPSSSLK